MHDLNTIRRMNREAALAAITESVTEADEVADADREAVEADRAQRDIYTLLAEALEDRARGWDESEEPDQDTAAYRAAQALRGISAEIHVDDAWDRFIGPMLDRMEEEYGR